MNAAASQYSLRHALAAGLACLSFWAGVTLAACPAVPEGFTPPPARRVQVELEMELDQPWQAGGAIVLVCGPDGSPRAGRLPRPPRDQQAERARRAEHFALARRINLARKGEVNARTLPLAQPQLEFLERFAMSDAGAVWFREVADDTLRMFNQGYLDYDRALWNRAVKNGPMPRLSRLLTGRLSEEGQFASELEVFKFGAYHGPGAMAQPAGIGLGNKGMQCQFPTSEELVDPQAILSHEFGHTRYGDPDSAGTLLGEARTVELYENPVRVRNGYEPRTVYFQRTNQGGLEARKDSLLDRLKILEKDKGISVRDLRAVERYHCDCPGPLPVILDCEVRELPPGQDLSQPTTKHDCKLHWKGDQALVPAPLSTGRPAKE
ncbi:MAG: hypothetical protein H6988_12315 [Pseudomonadales bacterium]|nr:hypothetical protein [Pseudomonadales bacterium]MCP5277923.1 hypothetical protein [Thiobacillus sp.]